jgi:hypothetical protein
MHFIKYKSRRRLTRLMKIQRFLIILGFALSNAAFASGSVSPNSAHLIGYLILGSDELVNAIPAPSLLTNAIVLRDPYSNALEIVVSPPQNEHALSSIIPKTYFISFAFHTDKELPVEVPYVFMPVAVSLHITVEKTSVAMSRHEILLLMSMDRLGADLLLATLFSPGGVQGVAQFSNASLVLPLEARAEQPWFAWGTVWTNSKKKTKEILLRSEVEYPVLVDEVTFSSGGTTRTIPVRRRLKPWTRMLIKCPVTSSEIDWSTFKITKRIERKVPSTLQQLTLKHER